jgi:hypothetical protein
MLSSLDSSHPKPIQPLGALPHWTLLAPTVCLCPGTRH